MAASTKLASRTGLVSVSRDSALSITATADQKVEATTDTEGRWQMPLIVNAEGDTAATTWSIEGYNQYVTKVFEVKSLFIASSLSVSLGDLEKTSAQNLKAAKDATISRLLVVSDYTDYSALPDTQKRPTDIVLVRGA